MNREKKRLPWRCKNAKQAKDKATIYNSREWKALRIQKLRANPLCERCEQEGFIRSAHCVHHIVPIETAKTMDEMRRLALDCGLNGLMSLCDECHHKIHEEMRSFDPASVKEREEARHERWKDAMMKRFIKPSDTDPTPTENPAAPI